MSFEGYDEFLCPNGHYWAQDTWAMKDPECPYCGEKETWTHTVDQTNGIVYMEDGNPHHSTVSYPLEEVDYVDVWHKDHYGHRYAKKLPIYKIPNTVESTDSTVTLKVGYTYQTREGWLVTIVEHDPTSAKITLGHDFDSDKIEPFPFKGISVDENGDYTVGYWKENGQYDAKGEETEYDLIEEVGHGA